MRIRIQDSQMNANPDPQHCWKGNLMEEALQLTANKKQAYLGGGGGEPN